MVAVGEHRSALGFEEYGCGVRIGNTRGNREITSSGLSSSFVALSHHPPPTLNTTTSSIRSPFISETSSIMGNSSCRLLRFNNTAPPGEEPSAQWVPVKLPTPAQPLKATDSLNIYSWNIDFSTPNNPERTRSGMNYLRSILSSSPLSPTIILLQEITYEGLEEIFDHAFIQQHFYVTERPNKGYFTTTLVSKGVPISGLMRIPFEFSQMGRDVLYVDVLISGGGVLRVANTHLESLEDPRKKRQAQLTQIAEVLRERGVVAGIVGGDMNAITPYDSEYPQFPEIALSDVWDLQRQRVTVDEEDRDAGEKGNTWGYQTSPNRYGIQRLDKFFYTGGLEFLPVDTISAHGVSGNGRILGMIGVGAKYEYNEETDEVPEGNKDISWITDHYGLAVKVAVNV